MIDSPRERGEENAFISSFSAFIYVPSTMHLLSQSTLCDLAKVYYCYIHLLLQSIKKGIEAAVEMESST